MAKKRKPNKQTAKYFADLARKTTTGDEESATLLFDAISDILFAGYDAMYNMLQNESDEVVETFNLCFAHALRAFSLGTQEALDIDFESTELEPNVTFSREQGIA